MFPWLAFVRTTKTSKGCEEPPACKTDWTQCLTAASRRPKPRCVSAGLLFARLLPPSLDKRVADFRSAETTIPDITAGKAADRA
jgi:hypothetical protein